MGNQARIIDKCQICESSRLAYIARFGTVPAVNDMVPVGVNQPIELRFPLSLVRCENCDLVQLDCIVPKQILFPAHYPYLSNSTQILHTNFAELADEARSRLSLSPSARILDIGSNDGTLLSKFKALGCSVLGVEPTDASKNAIEADIPTRNDYFSSELAREIVSQEGHFDVVTAANVFAHIDDINDVLLGVRSLLSPSGTFISESHYLGSVINGLQFDTVYHEHLRYYSLTSLANLFQTHGMTITYAKFIPTHGGSIRVYASSVEGATPDPVVAKILTEEVDKGLASKRLDDEFSKKVANAKLQLVTQLTSLKVGGARIVGIGAPSRASTLINYCGLDEDTIDAVLEISTSNKLKKYIPGTKIPVIDEKNLHDLGPDYLLILSWHIAEELISIFKKKGFTGKFIVPLPSFEIRV